MTERTMLKKNAVQKPSTLNPGTIADTIIIIKAFITRVNNPKVRILIGNVRITNKGFMNIFTSPNTKATNNAVRNPDKVTPGKI